MKESIALGLGLTCSICSEICAGYWTKLGEGAYGYLCTTCRELHQDGWLDLVQLVAEVVTDDEGRVRDRLE